MTMNKPIELGKVSEQTKDPGAILVPDHPGSFTTQPRA
jgi:hypothetical protein